MGENQGDPARRRAEQEEVRCAAGWEEPRLPEEDRGCPGGQAEEVLLVQEAEHLRSGPEN